MAKMLGKIHGPQCDCNIEQHVSGKSEKCNHRYGVKRQRSREKAKLRKEVAVEAQCAHSSTLDY